MKCFFVVFLWVILSACSGRPPFLEYTLAHSALQSANKVKSRYNAYTQWAKAVAYYNQGKASYHNRSYISAKRFFNESLRWSEQAENISRLKMSTGEDL